jgi:SAM-dependent methyltransferase
MAVPNTAAPPPPDYGSPAYWQARYGALPPSSPPFEWLADWRTLGPHVLARLRPGADPDAEVLVAGCGTSSLPADLHAAGCANVSAVDVAPAAVAWQAARYGASLPDLDVSVLDATDMTDELPDGCFAAVVEKALGDALLCGGSSSDGGARRLARFASEAARVLRPGGLLLSVSRLPPDVRLRHLLAAGGGGAWDDGATEVIPLPLLLSAEADGGSSELAGAPSPPSPVRCCYLYVLRRAG